MKPPVILPKVFLWIGIPILVSLWMSGCKASSGSTPQPSFTTLLTPIITELPSVTSALPAPTPTSIPPTRTPNPTISMTPTVVISSLTPLPTLSVDEAQAVILDLLQNNGDCQLPCWWGLTPGETDSQEVKSFLEQFGSLLNYFSVFDDRGGGVYLEIPRHDLIVRPNVEYETNAGDNTVEQFSVSIDIVRKIDDGYEYAHDDPLFAQLMQPYSLSKILSTYGTPSEVLVQGIRGPWLFYIVLAYVDEGFLIKYDAPFEEDAGTFFSCPTKAHVTLWLWPPERGYSLEEAAKALFRVFGKGWLEGYLPIEDATSYTSDIFFEVFKDTQNTSCLETPLNLWPEP